jgi:hypothetical protein
MRWNVTTVTVVLSLLLGCTTSRLTGDPGVTKEGRWRVWHTGTEAVVEVSYLWAQQHLGSEWVVLKIGIAGTDGPVPLTLGDFTLTTPQARTVEPLDQSSFRQVHGRLRAGLRSIDAWRGPSKPFMSGRQPCDRWFITPPHPRESGWTGQRLNADTIFPSSQIGCGGPLVFRPPGGFQPGRWILTIDFAEVTARIPFEIDGRRLPPA